MTEPRRLDPVTERLRSFADEAAAATAVPALGPHPRRGRHRRGRTLVLVGAAVVVFIAAGVLALVYGPRSANNGPGTPTTHHPKRTPSTVVGRLRSTTFTGAFQPSEIVSAAGRLWLIDERALSSGTGTCSAGALDPASLTVHPFPLASCGFNAVAGGGHLYLETETGQPGTNDWLVHIESVSLAQPSSVVLAPVDVTVVGSEIAHTQLAYANGHLWLDAYSSDRGQTVVEIAPASGVVVGTFTGVPPGGGVEPLLTAGPGGVWAAGGAGGSTSPAVVNGVGTGAVHVLPPVVASNENGTIEWMAPVGALMWLDVATFTPSQGLRQTQMEERLVEMDSAGTVVRRSGVEALGSSLVTVGGNLYSVGDADSCAVVHVYRVDPASLHAAVVATLRPPGASCLGGSERPVAAVGGSLYVLNPTSSGSVLYRYTP